jgi:hypothetical protein
MVKFTRGDAHLGIIMASVSEICSTTHINGQSLPVEAEETMDAAVRNSLGFQAESRTPRDQDAVDDTAMKELRRIYLAVEGTLPNISGENGTVTLTQDENRNVRQYFLQGTRLSRQKH